MENQNTNQNPNSVFPDEGVVQPPPLVVFGNGQSISPGALSSQGSVVSEESQGPPLKRPNIFVRALKRADVILAILLVLSMIGMFILISKGSGEKTNANNGVGINGQYGIQEIPLESLGLDAVGLGSSSGSVVINGSTQLNGGLIIMPSLQPSAPKSGQLYYDQSANVLAYYNGTTFVTLGETSTSDETPDGVRSIGGLSGQVSLGGGLAAVGNQLVNAGVLSLGGQGGALVLGSGLSLSGNSLQNTGILNVIAGTDIAVSNDGNGNVTISNTGSGTGTVTSSGGTAGQIPIFTGSQNIEDSLISQSGLTVTVSGDLNVVTGGLSLTNALTVANGGTGVASLAVNGVLVGNGTGAISTVTAGGTGLCLVSTAGAPIFTACPSSSGVTTLNGLNGALSVANASSAGSTITINNASTSSKGIAQFNATNFTDNGAGTINTIQNINTAATPTFAGINTNSINPSATLTVGSAAQTLILQGDAGLVITATSGANTTTVGFNAPSADVNINFPALSAGSYDICTTFGNCLGGSGGGANTALSNLASVAINTTLLPGAAGGIDLGSATLPFGDIYLAGTSGTPGTNNFRITGASTGGTRVITLPDDSGTICLDTGNCASAGGGVTTSGGTLGTLPVFTGAQTVGDSLVSQSGGTVTVGGNLNLTTGNQLQINGTQISSANLSNDSNLAKVGASQTFTGDNNSFRNGTNSSNAFSVQNAAGTHILTVDTSAGQLQLGMANVLDAGLVFYNDGNTNAVTILPGTPTGDRTITLPDDSGIVCLDTGNCAGAGATLQTAYNFSVGGTTPKIKVSSGLQTVDIQDADTPIGGTLLAVRESNGSGLGQIMFGIDSTGEVILQNGTNSTTAFRLLTDGGTSVLTGDTQNGRVILGQGGTLAGQLLLQNASNGNAGTLQTAVLGQSTIYTLPDPGAGTATICLSSGNCAGVGGVGDVLQGGNSFGAALTLGTNDAYDFNLETGGVTRLTIESDGSQVTFASNLDLILQGASAYISNPQDNFANSEAFGLNASVSGANGSTAVGSGASAAAASRSVAFGRLATANADDAVAIGEGASATNNGGIAIGVSSTAGFASTAIGYDASASHNSAIALGNGATTTAANQMVIGGNGYQINQLVIGNGVTNATPAGFTLQGTSGSGSNVAGAGVTIAGGQGTGTGNGGNIQFQVAKPGSTGSSLNTLANVLTLSGTDGSALFKNASNSTTGFQVQNAGSSAILNVNTTNSQVAINGATVGSQGFESVTFPPASPGTWTRGGSANWARTTATFQEGVASAASGTIADSQISWLDLDYTFTVDGVLRFYWKVDSEDCGDVFCDGAYLLVDDDAGDYFSSYSHIAGSVNWVEVNVPVTAGAHSFRWVYSKDDGASSGSDKAWIDNVRIIEGGLTVNGALTSLGLAVSGSVAVGGDLNAGLIQTGNLVATDTVLGSTIRATNDLVANDDVIVDDFLYVSGGAEYYGDVALYNGNSTTAFVAYNSSDVPQFTVDSTNSRVYIGNTATDTTGALLILDTKTSSGDPTGVNGGMYYNSNSGKFRCYENSTWKNCISDLPIASSYNVQMAGAYSKTGTSYSTIPELDPTITKYYTDTKLLVNFSLNRVICNSSCGGNTGFAINVGGVDYDCAPAVFLDSTTTQRSVYCSVVIPAGVAAGSVTVAGRWRGHGASINFGIGGGYVTSGGISVLETH